MNKYMLTIVLVLLTFFQSIAQDKEILQVFENQLKAFNQSNVEQLVNNVSDDFKFYYLTSNELLLEVEGKEQFRKSMDDYFAGGFKVISKILDYSILGNRISFKEEVSYKNAKGDFVSSFALGIYEIENNKITRAWYFD
jgi:hypothetical protein